MPGVSSFLSLDEYLQSFRKEFRRKDRFFWAKVYVEGLLGSSERKTIEGIARSIVVPKEPHTEDACQALQNFIQGSPWDERRLMRQYRQQVVQLLGPDGVLVVEDVVLLKQGQHSVGVHRQYNPDQKKKVNCQILTAVFLITNDVVVPLSFRLYLPRVWQEDLLRLAKSKVPATDGVIVSKIQLALDVLEEFRSEELPYSQLVAGESYARSDEFRAGVAALDVRLLPQDERKTELGSAETYLRRVRELSAHLKDHLGLDHFEGRTWRGLHHHLCLVVLAHGYELHQKLPARE